MKLKVYIFVRFYALELYSTFNILTIYSMYPIKAPIGFQSKKVTHIISYDLPTGTTRDTYEIIWKEIKTLWEYCIPLKSFWTINSKYSCEDIVNSLSPLMPTGGKLYVLYVHSWNFIPWWIDNSNLELKEKSPKSLQSIVTRALPKQLTR